MSCIKKEKEVFKWKKGIVTTILATLVVSVPLPAIAANTTENEKGNKLVEKGLDESIVELMPKKERDESISNLLKHQTNFK